jgi:mevalonate kinase
MNLAVEKSLTSLRSRDEGFRFEELKSSIELANDCFLQWGLVTGKMLSYYDRLYTFGATAVKPTGSGGGGYILSLWSQPPPKELLDKMIAIDF